MPLRVAFGAFSLPHYRRFFLGQLCALIGYWMQTTALAWLVLQHTRSAFAVGLLSMLQFLPATALSLVGGALADRLPKHRMLLVVQSLGLVQAAMVGLLLVAGPLPFWQLGIAAALLGTIGALEGPAREPLGIELAGAGRTSQAVGLFALLFTGSRVLGSAVAGLLIATGGSATVMLLSAACFLPAITSLLVLRRPHARAVQRTPALPDPGMRPVLRYVRQTPPVMLVLIASGAIGIFGYNFNATLPLIAEFLLHTDATGFGLLGAAFSLGSVAAALLTTTAARVSRRRLLLGASGFSLLLTATALTSVFAVATVLLAALGLAGMTVASTANALLQHAAPPAMRGRMMGLYQLLFSGSTPLGSLAIGAAAGWVGVPVVILGCAGLCALGVLAAFVYGRLRLPPEAAAAS